MRAVTPIRTCSRSAWPGPRSARKMTISQEDDDGESYHPAEHAEQGVRAPTAQGEATPLFPRRWNWPRTWWDGSWGHPGCCAISAPLRVMTS